MTRSRGWAAGLVILATAAGAVVGTAVFARTHQTVVHSNRCTATVGQSAFTTTTDRSNLAALIAVRATAYGLGTDAATVALATAIQESGLRNLAYGDRDSIGIFQQRPSQGWGTKEQILDAYYATRKFYQALKKVPAWQELRVTEAAQAVQRSGFPEAYAVHESEARVWATALRGEAGPAAITCDLYPAAVGSVDALITRVKADYSPGTWDVAVIATVDGTTEVRFTPRSGAVGDRRLAQDSLANWAVATAADLSISRVKVGTSAWIRTQGLTTLAQPDAVSGVVIAVVTQLK